MAAASPRWKVILGKARAFAGWLASSLKSQWLATALILPLGFFALQTHTARQDAREARTKAIAVDRLGKFQSSGKALDSALALYLQSVGELALAERNIQAPGAYTITPVKAAQTAVLEARKEARKALADHAGDVQSLHGYLDNGREQQYMSSLADINNVVEADANINATGNNIKALGRLVMARNALVDQATGKAI